MSEMQRREFVTLIGGTAAAWPVAARAQQPAMPVIGYLNPTSIETGADRLRGLQRGLKETGYVAGENVAIGDKAEPDRVFGDGEDDGDRGVAMGRPLLAPPGRHR
jgi:hypothetical protein